MESIQSNAVWTAEKAVPTVKKRKWSFRLSLAFYPVGIFRIWRSKTRVWLKLAYTLLGFPVFVLTAGYLAIVFFAAFLPPLDRTVGPRTDRRIVNSEGNYAATFVKTGVETGGAYELVEVELEPYGGNDWHYHANFEESFTVVEGAVRIGQDGKEILLKKGASASAAKKELHYFKNANGEKSVLLVKITPAAGLEKTLRVGYGLINDGKLHNDMTENPWHMVLLLAYSESYLPAMPRWFQEPLIGALAKIAQWRGEDKALYQYFK
ncbi:cupin domain-containing protein [Chitinophaga sp. GCM10012297]|uniref:Cupin domain-containing protein n=1 Tax=Chitinophaga chungangae TaxID=2821488 RepID=A0ABS3YKT2_9BACT|nr:cupin domain-containing protein [Chitinophaga chungangae]MBO9154719.1 cupin domain-containing protein [Chitinophaga chungangae]